MQAGRQTNGQMGRQTDGLNTLKWVGMMRDIREVLTLFQTSHSDGAWTRLGQQGVRFQW